jgi:hypothetical protein
MSSTKHQFVVPDNLKEISPDGYAVIRKRMKDGKRQYRTTIFAENGQALQDSRQWFEKLSIAQENLAQTIKVFGGTKILVLDLATQVQWNYFLSSDCNIEYFLEEDE